MGGTWKSSYILCYILCCENVIFKVYMLLICTMWVYLIMCCFFFIVLYFVYCFHSIYKCWICGSGIFSYLVKSKNKIKIIKLTWWKWVVVMVVKATFNNISVISWSVKINQENHNKTLLTKKNLIANINMTEDN
jgi:hypothetical protein